jgi:hypothetical protein
MLETEQLAKRMSESRHIYKTGQETGLIGCQVVGSSNLSGRAIFIKDLRNFVGLFYFRGNRGW